MWYLGAGLVWAVCGLVGSWFGSFRAILGFGWLGLGGEFCVLGGTMRC